MPRCLSCNQKFVPKVFLQKFCDDEECVSAKLEYQANKISGAKKTQKPIKKVSEKRSVENLQYSADRIVFLGKPENKICFIEGCNRPATTIEHTAGRKGFYDDWARDNNISLFLDQRFWKPCCGPHNTELENNSELSKQYQLSKIHGGKKL